MLKNQNIICISSIDWDFIWQRHQEIMSAFAKYGNRVLFIENTGVRTPKIGDIPRLKKRFINWAKSVKGFREETDNLYIYSPVIFPFPYSKFARWLNRCLIIPPLKKWIEIMRFYEPIIWTYLPTGTALDIIANIDQKLLVYDCVADFEELADSPKKIRKTENELIKKSNLIFAQGEKLKKKCENLNNNVHIFAGGVNIEIFNISRCKLNCIPSDIREIKKPIIGYIGGIHRHIDFELIRFIAKSHPEWSIVMIGPMQTEVSTINNLNNIFLLGEKYFSVLPDYINEFNVGIIPYIKNAYTETVFPTKINEYHAIGKPVVSTNLPEIVSFNAQNNNLVLIADTYEGFVSSISKAIHNDNEKSQKERIGSACNNSWNNKIEEMSILIERMIEKKLTRPLNWEEALIRTYKRAKRKISRIGILVLAVYLLFFYTPFVWFLASPLKISQRPQKADAIVVFAGGVGESGKSGEGYQERVEYAVDLYKKGYAKYIIFSSGYTHIFKEPLVMQVLAISLGVPEDAIILEDKAVNTYENVKFSKEILKKNNWHNILFLSSPYHMRRARLVFQKNASDINVIYLPVEKSIFYQRPSSPKIISKTIKLRQIRGILHEYLGILYYWWKAYI